MMKSFFAFVTVAVLSTSITAAPVQKRQSGTATYYEPGLGSCGQTDSADSMIVAVNTADASGNEHCGKTVSITNEETGQSVNAKVADLCPTCSSGDLDLSPAVFQALGGTQDQGVFPISWSMDGASGSSGSKSSESSSPSSTASASASSSTSSSGSDQQQQQQSGQNQNQNQNQGQNQQQSSGDQSQSQSQNQSQNQNQGQNQKRDGDGTATFYEPGLGSCGQVDTAGDKIVAINSAQGAGNEHCGKTVTITNNDNGQSTTAKVTDLCPTCNHGDLDLSPAVFQALGGTEDQGVFPISWSFS